MFSTINRKVAVFLKLFQSIKLFFTNSDYRWACKEGLWIWFLSRKPINYIISWIIAFRFNRQSKGMDRWEKYQLQREYENSVLKWAFFAHIYNLILILMARGTDKDNPQEFDANRNDMLSSELIDYPEYSKVKEWLKQNDNFNTADLPSLAELYDSFMSK